MQFYDMTKYFFATSLLIGSSLAHSAQVTVDLEDLTNGGGDFSGKSPLRTSVLIPSA